jgi:hypothetical protein
MGRVLQLARLSGTDTIRRMRHTRKLITCHDCGAPVSFSATVCPRCGSQEPAGPYVFNERERRQHRIEERNDRNLIVIASIFGVVGALYGVDSSAGGLEAFVRAVGYGLGGILFGVPIAFGINMTRSLWR